jgi:uncharacterized protein YraI
MKKLLCVLITLVMLVTGFGMAQTTYAQAPTGIVNTGALNIRSGPGVSYGVVTYVYRNTVLSLLSRNADASWVKVATTTGVQGWVNAHYILTSYPLSGLPIEGATGGITGVVTGYALHVRSGPGTGYAVLTSIYGGTVLTLISRTYDAAWLKVILPTGAQGWVSTRYVRTSYPVINLPVEGGTTPAPTPTPSPTYRTHVVQPGENLFRISLNYGVNMYDVARLNGITNLALIYVGQVLLIP